MVVARTKYTNAIVQELEISMLDMAESWAAMRLCSCGWAASVD